MRRETLWSHGVLYGDSMEKIASFTIDHNNLFAGLYVSRVDGWQGATVTTFDLRFTAPNKEEPMAMPAIHTIEHLGATYFRNSSIKDQVVYFGPMGCRTGFYLVLFGKWTSEGALSCVKEFCKFVLEFEGEIPGAKPEECGNYAEQDLVGAKKYVKRYLDELNAFERLRY